MFNTLLINKYSTDKNYRFENILRWHISSKELHVYTTKVFLIKIKTDWYLLTLEFKNINVSNLKKVDVSVRSFLNRLTQVTNCMALQ